MTPINADIILKFIHSKLLMICKDIEILKQQAKIGKVDMEFLKICSAKLEKKIL